MTRKENAVQAKKRLKCGEGAGLLALLKSNVGGLTLNDIVIYLTDTRPTWWRQRMTVATTEAAVGERLRGLGGKLRRVRPPGCGKGGPLLWLAKKVTT